ncbi:hypothetical protein BDN72DRAFT_796721 [Pluteus cervinus]|uniref:Uncharacterized protein n=1 Tax=Pluteus cervinus TaxID=181527 RepID=A0ACD3AUR3_9AGAR|nr:hypothetical protein BDN72DRAFT_796721 [Pluteus cervinus]
MQNRVLPAEVWSRIFEFSCRDNGYTGQSLSLTSRAFNTFSAPYKFQSISLQSIKYVLRFLSVLRDTPPNLRRIRYLCIAYDGLLRPTYGKQPNWETRSSYDSASDSDDMSDSGDVDHSKDVAQIDGNMEYSPLRDVPDWGKVSDDDTEDVPLSKEDMDEIEEDTNAIKLPERELPPNYPLQSSLVPDDDSEDEDYFDRVFLKALHEILQMCADTLLILSVHVDFITVRSESFPILPVISLPRLQELTWAVPLPNQAIVVDLPFVTPRSAALVRFPALQRLCLTGGIDPTISRIIATHCPKLLYLRTILKFAYFQEEVAQKAQTARNFDQQPPIYISAATPPSVIRHLLDFNCEEGTSDMMWLLNDHELGDVSLKEVIDPRVKFCIYQDKGWNGMQSDWQDRILGEVGGWDWEECMFEVYDEY